MLKYKDITSRSTGETHRQYTINQGDTFSLYAKETGDEKVFSSFKFKICENYPTPFFEQDFTYDETLQKFICKIESKDTNEWKVNIDDEAYKYEIEGTYIDGNKVSVELFDFYVDYQVGDE